VLLVRGALSVPEAGAAVPDRAQALIAHEDAV
jgi:hypothetical protein